MNFLRQYRTIPALRLKHRSDGSPRQEPPQAAVALRSASLRLGVRHGICVAKMLDNVGLRYPHRASGAKAPRTLRPLPLLRFAVSATGGAHLCSIQYYLRFWLGICRTSLTVSALRIMRYCQRIGWNIMQYTIENEYLRLTVDTHGAEAVSVVNKATGAEMLWCGDPAVWGRHAPILFPYTGKLTGGKMIAKGKEYAGGQHGFARDVEHTLVGKTETSLTLVLQANEETRAKWPYEFELRSTFELVEKTVRHTLAVYNPSEPELRFGIGYHPAFAIPFDDAHTPADYEFRFDELESPLCVSCLPNGLLNGTDYHYLARNTRTVPLTDDLFDYDSHCMLNLRSKTLAIVEKDTGRAVRCNIEGYPYVLIWSKPEKPYRFVCIEPWHSLPGEENGPLTWENRPCAAALHPGETWSTTLCTTFER